MEEILKLFKVMVVDSVSTKPVTDYVDRGLVLNFVPNEDQLAVLNDFYKPLDVRTLFTREERDNADPFDLITKQLLHYFEVYGLDTPGLFNLEVLEGQIVTMTFVRGVTEAELAEMVQELLYSNAPVSDAEAIKQIILKNKINIDINRVANNELRVGLFNVQNDTFENGDDAVRYMCYSATDNLMLIKSREVVGAISESPVSVDFLERHKMPLAQVFNRHKRLIMAAKNKDTRTVINQISRLSKTRHVPIREHISKRFLSTAIDNPLSFDFSVLDKISLRDKFKYLNLLSYKKEKMDADAFIIRNGKIYVKTDRAVWNLNDIDYVESTVLNSIKSDLAHLSDKKILLDNSVSYGLPTSRKQTIGQLPFGTRVSVKEGQISSGMYWENNWGATDLDLSTIDIAGNRTGWGQFSGYDADNPVTFSGDITSAPKGAMEFMTSNGQDYGLFVNIYSGEVGSDMELVVGGTNDRTWIKDTIIREKHKLNSRGNIIGFVRDREFIVYSGRLGGGRWSGPGNRSIVTRGMSDFWTVNRLFDAINIKYDVDKSDKISYNYELDYEGFSYDKLEALLLK